MPTVRARKSHIFARENSDHYVEPNWVSDRLFDVEDFGAMGSLVLDPCCGWCRIPQAARRHGYKTIASDITQRISPQAAQEENFRSQNIFEFGWQRIATSVITNPPFNILEEIARRCVDLAQYKAALICPLRRLPAAHWLKELGLYRMLFLSPRPSMPSGPYISSGGKVGGGQQDFVWLIFKKGHVGSFETDWLHRDKIT